MPRARSVIPSYRLHKASGQAVVTIEGRDFYLGRHDTKASREAYERLLISWKAHGLPAAPKRTAELPLTVGALVARYLAYIEREGLYMKNGKPTSERNTLAVALRPLVRLFSTKAAASFAPPDMLVVRSALCEPLPPPKPGEPATGRWHVGPIARASVNAHLGRIKRMFRWGVETGIVPGSTWHAVQAVRGFRRGQSALVRESEDVKPAPAKDVAIVLRAVEPAVAGAIRFQWLTGCRPGEALQLRMRDIDRKGKVWAFTPQSHKTQHHGRTREVMIGPKAQRLLERHLKADPSARLFPISGSKYRDDIREACRVAGIKPWAPNQLRHAAGTRFRHALGIESARVALGHADAGITEVYAERDRKQAIVTAAQLG